MKVTQFLFAWGFLSVSPALADVLEVGTPNAPYPTIAAAITAAQDGDLILVSPGVYSGFAIQGKSLAIASTDSTVPIQVTGTVNISGLQAQQSVSLRGLAIDVSGFQQAAMRLSQCFGRLVLEDCRMESESRTGTLVVQDCRRVQVSRSTILNLGLWSGDGIQSQQSSLFLHATQAQGGDGPPEHGPAGIGGHGLRASGDQGDVVFVQDCVLRGGVGSTGFQSLACFSGGRGGNGFFGTGLRFYAHASTLIPGVGGTSPCAGQAPPGDPANFITSTIPGTHRDLTSAEVLPSGAVAELTLIGVPGDRVSYTLQREGDLVETRTTPALAPHGQFLKGQATQEWRFAGQIGPSGQMTLSVPVPTVPTGQSHDAWFVQALVVQSQVRRFTHPVRLQVIDPAVGDTCRLFSAQSATACENLHINSTGVTGELVVVGDACLSSNSQELRGVGLPVQQSGLFLCSPEPGWIFHPFQTQGAFCLSQNFGVYPIGAPSDSNGSLFQTIDGNAMPTSTAVPFLSGATWHFQLWYRDGDNGSTGPSSHVTNSVAVTLW